MARDIWWHYHIYDSINKKFWKELIRLLSLHNYC
jgi:hypothetical protein